MRILIVEDNEFNRIVLGDMIELLYPEAEVQMHESAEVSLQEGGHDTFDLILSDIDMPGMDGMALFTKLRKELGVKVPIVAVTALAISGDRERILMHGFDAYISKPINLDELEAILKTFLGAQE
ncbi:MAG: response regulator [Campylobacterales bacterium]|nr:response regulator [Campylobacterales bacterium]